MVQRARAEAKKPDWSIGSKVPLLPRCRCLHRSDSAGEKVVASRPAPVFESIRQYLSDALGVEMEEYGFLEATHSDTGIEALSSGGSRIYRQ